MDQVKEIARNVVLVVFLAGVLEMLLPPKSGMGKYIQLIMGLFVIVSILTPVMSLLHQELALDALAVNGNTGLSEQQSIFQKGLEMKAQNEDWARNSALNKMNKQVAALARLVPGVEEAHAEILVEEDFIRTGEIKLVKVFTTLRQHSDKSAAGVVKPVKVELTEGNEELTVVYGPEEIKSRVKETIMNFYGLRAEQIEVFIKQ
ncbi:stage III sporulation protein AF [Zhaonella formicivorans]|uniref:stage III sporulation protein AF n=1 Tax=Zhaonella formicivorans TaxID=2528593 RepID=UPI001D12D1AB|nr:stage III sporulation protein AF [Zhaonella formicivorans]